MNADGAASAVDSGLEAVPTSPTITQPSILEANDGRQYGSLLLKYFRYAQLPAYLQDISRPFGELAKAVAVNVPYSEEREFGMRKLLLAKDAIVRACLDVRGQGPISLTDRRDEVGRELIDMLSKYCGEDGDLDFADGRPPVVVALERIIAERDALLDAQKETVDYSDAVEDKP